MSESLKAICQLLLGIGGIGTILVWGFWYPGQDPWLWWPARLALPGILGLSAWPLIKLGMQEDQVPDHLLRCVGDRYFTRDEFAFALVPSVREGYFQWCVLFQNCWERGCDALILIRHKPEAKAFRVAGRDESLTTRIQIKSEGGAFGVAGACVIVPQKFWGQETTFELFADVRYPNGRGRRLRKTFGMPVGTAKTRQTELLSATSILVSVAGAATGTMLVSAGYSSPAEASIHFAPRYSDDPASLPPAELQFLWRPDAELIPPTIQGFPVRPSNVCDE